MLKLYHKRRKMANYEEQDRDLHRLKKIDMYFKYDYITI